MPPGTFVVVSGPPASGKTTLAVQVAPALGLPLIAKDTIKQALMTVLPVPDVETSRTVGTASVAALLAVAGQTGGAVLESVWHHGRAVAGLRLLPGSIVEVFCRCGPETARHRYALRAATRGAGHFDAQRTAGELWNEEVAQPVADGWPVIEADTNSPVDVDRGSGGDGSHWRSILRSPCAGVHHSTTSIVPSSLRWVCTTSAMSAWKRSPSGPSAIGPAAMARPEIFASPGHCASEPSTGSTVALCRANRGSRRRSAPLRAFDIEPNTRSPSSKTVSIPEIRGDPSARKVAMVLCL